MDDRWVALTGTPGVGKTSVARVLRRLGTEVVDGNAFAARHDCFRGRDSARGARIVDPARVGRAVRRQRLPPGAVGVLEGHWVHLVPGVTDAIVLRLHPRPLERRLARRGWRRAKVQENLEAECIDQILLESLGELGRRHVGELDMTRRTPTSAARRIRQILQGRPLKVTNLEIGSVDWSQELLRWF